MRTLISPGRASFLLPASPPPLHPHRGEGELEHPILFLGLPSGFGASDCDTDLSAEIGELGSRSEWIGAWGRSGNSLTSIDGVVAQAVGQRRKKSILFKPLGVCNVSASERAYASRSPLGRAEQRSGARIRAGACLSVASLRLTPGGASSARYPAGARPLARLSFAYFSLAKQRKVRPAAGSKQAKSPNLYLEPPTQESKK